ncbi:hypothetical protein [Rhodococcus wratislaviensis]|uniref:PE domain-containing protein n=1 Tax=Rhodococcus wratislaviensis NBRC 100605 TaxID=1219028 RepID=X0Q1E6_RHOWR|nr:hypothetical protein [Rhodococcus wratislaviensis]GAF49848.1 hypothetical protein RW1_093_03380 [Rhodococcus wratislaviensis NBRC 100605]
MAGPEAPEAGWTAFTENITGGGRLELDPAGIEQCIKLCQEHAELMGDLADNARQKLRAADLGIGERDIDSAKQLARKFDEKALGGGDIEFANTAVGLFGAHQTYAKDMKSMFEAVLARYNEQDAAIASSLGSVGGNL